MILQLLGIAVAISERGTHIGWGKLARYEPRPLVAHRARGSADNSRFSSVICGEYDPDRLSDDGGSRSDCHRQGETFRTIEDICDDNDNPP